MGKIKTLYKCWFRMKWTRFSNIPMVLIGRKPCKMKRAKYSRFRITTGRVGLSKILEITKSAGILHHNSATMYNSSNR